MMFLVKGDAQMLTQMKEKENLLFKRRIFENKCQTSKKIMLYCFLCFCKGSLRANRHVP